MPDQQLLTYIQQQTQLGVSPEIIKLKLIESGWQTTLIDEAFSVAQTTPPNVSPPFPSNEASISNQPVRELSAKELLMRTIEVFKKHSKVILIIQALPVLTQFLFGGAVSITMEVLKNPTLYPENINTTLYIVTFLLMLASMILSMWSSASLIVVLRDSDEDLSFFQAYGRGKLYIFSYWWVGFLYGVTVVAGFLLLIIPAILFSIWYGFAQFTVIDENKKGWDAIERSRYLTTGHVISICKKFGFVFIIFLVISLIIILPAAAIQYLDVAIGNAIYQGVSALVQLVLTAMNVIFTYQMYQNYKQLKDDGDVYIGKI